jgi:hypothetical protein
VNDGLLEQVLKGLRDVVVPRVDRRARLARRTEKPLQLRGEEAPGPRLAARAVQCEQLAHRKEEGAVEAIAATRQQLDKFPQLAGIGRASERGQAHDLVLVAVRAEAEILRDPGVERPQRVGEVAAADDREPIPRSMAEGSADQVADPVGRTQSRVLKRGDVIGAGQVGGVMLDAMYPRQATGTDLQRAGEVLLQRCVAGDTPRSTKRLTKRRAGREREDRPTRQMRAGVTAHADPVDVRPPYPGNREAPPHRLGGEAGAVLHACEPLLLDGGHQLAIGK